MTKIIMLGCNGRMGQMITDMVKQDDECDSKRNKGTL